MLRISLTRMGPLEPAMEADVEHLLIAEIDHMIARAQRRAMQHGRHVGALRGDARKQSQVELKNVQRSLERLRRYRDALLTERAPGSAPS